MLSASKPGQIKTHKLEENVSIDGEIKEKNTFWKNWWQMVTI